MLYITLTGCCIDFLFDRTYYDEKEAHTVLLDFNQLRGAAPLQVLRELLPPGHEVTIKFNNMGISMSSTVPIKVDDVFVSNGECLFLKAAEDRDHRLRIGPLDFWLRLRQTDYGECRLMR